jgi:hypothetical protein
MAGVIKILNVIDFSKLFQRDKGFSLPVLIKLKHEGKLSWHFTNNSIDILLDGTLYKSVPMSYKFPGSRDGIPLGGVLEIDPDHQDDAGNELLKWFDEATNKAEIEIFGIINEHGEIRKLGRLAQKNGTVSWDGQKITWNLGEDARMNMQVNPWAFDGNALAG